MGLKKGGQTGPFLGAIVVGFANRLARGGRQGPKGFVNSLAHVFLLLRFLGSVGGCCGLSRGSFNIGRVACSSSVGIAAYWGSADLDFFFHIGRGFFLLDKNRLFQLGSRLENGSHHGQAIHWTGGFKVGRFVRKCSIRVVIVVVVSRRVFADKAFGGRISGRRRSIDIVLVVFFVQGLQVCRRFPQCRRWRSSHLRRWSVGHIAIGNVGVIEIGEARLRSLLQEPAHGGLCCC